MIPPEILEQIEKEADRKYGDIETAVSFGQKTGFKAGGQFGYSLCQKQTPPPTGREFVLDIKAWKLEQVVCSEVKDGERYTSGFFENERIHVREVTDRDQKIAQAVEGLVEAVRLADCFCTVSDRLSGHVIGCDIPKIKEALSKLEEAKK